MTFKNRFLFYVVFGVLTVSTAAFAEDLEDKWEASGSSDRLSLNRRDWEFGINLGMAFPVGRKTTSIVASHHVFEISDPDFLGEDEFAENGLPSPDFAGQSTISGDLTKSYLIGAHLYRNLTPFLAVGLEGSYAIENEIDIKQSGAFNVPIYITKYRYHGAQAVAAARIGGWIGFLRPWAMAGIGPYFLSETVTADLNDPDDPDHTPLEAANQGDVYTSTLIGGGLDIQVGNSGSVGFALQYQHVYSPGNNRKFVIPNVRFAYHF